MWLSAYLHKALAVELVAPVNKVVSQVICDTPDLYAILNLRSARQRSIGELHTRDVPIERNDPNVPIAIGQVFWCSFAIKRPHMIERRLERGGGSAVVAVEATEVPWDQGASLELRFVGTKDDEV
jgi:hypothetical protein